MNMDHNRDSGFGLYDPFTTTALTNGEPHSEPHHVIPRPSPRYTAFLDGLRGLAALLVLIQHYIGYFDGNVHEHGFGEHGNYYLVHLPFLRVFFSGGNAAVPIFFILSGYVLSKSPMRLVRNGKQHACAVSLLSSVIRRPMRLYMPTIGAALAYAILMHAPFHIVPVMPWPEPKETIFAEFTNWLFESIRFFNPFQTHRSSNHAWYSYNLVVWTIPIELKGSMLIYLLTAIYAFSGLPQSLSVLLLTITSIVLLHVGQWTMACFIAGLVLTYIDIYDLDMAYLASRSKGNPSSRTPSFSLGTISSVSQPMPAVPSSRSTRRAGTILPSWPLIRTTRSSIIDTGILGVPCC
jgi:peptidoglycan/LPS O-acetylase OafA/YrhL